MSPRAPVNAFAARRDCEMLRTMSVALIELPVSRPSRSVLPVWSRLFDEPGFSPLLAGLALATGLVAVFLALDWHDGNLDPWLRGEVPAWRFVEVRSAILVATLFAGVLVTHRYEEIGTRRDLAALAPELVPGALVSADVVAPRWLRAVGLLGAAVLVAIVPTLYRDPSRFLRLETYALPSVLLDLLVGAALGWATSRTLYAAVCEDRAFARLAEAMRDIDLLDLSPMRPFARRGLRRALRWLLLASIAALNFADAGYVEPPALVLICIVAFALFSFLLPVAGAHARIRREKRRTLEVLRAWLREERSRLHVAGVRDRASAGTLADLLAYERCVADVREWPIDATTLLRFSVYLLLPLGSWLGSALVQHEVERWLR